MPQEAKIAVIVYEVRRLGTQATIDSSRAASMMSTDGYGLNAEKLKSIAACRWNFIAVFDSQKAGDEAVRLLQRRLPAISTTYTG